MRKVNDGSASDPVLLAQIFFRTAWADSRGRYTNVYVRPEILDICLDTLNKARTLIDDIDRVLDDQEHAQIVDAARRLGFDLPNVDLFILELEEYREFLQAIDLSGLERHKGDTIKVPVTTAQSLNELMKRNCFMIARIFDDCFNTDYLKSFTVYKNEGLEYEGPNALQSTVNLLVAMARVHNQFEKYVSLGLMDPQWPLYLGYTQAPPPSEDQPLGEPE